MVSGPDIQSGVGEEGGLVPNGEVLAQRFFSGLPVAQKDKIISVGDRYKAAKEDFKEGRLALEPINLGVGTFVDVNGDVPRMRTVSMAVDQVENDPLFKKLSAYIPITGVPNFCRGTGDFILGEALAGALRIEGRLITVQTLGGTGAYRLGAELVGRRGTQEIFVSEPTWGNHVGIANALGIASKKYRYFDNKAFNLDFAGMHQDISAAPKGSVVTLQPSGHNPTSFSPSKQQWDSLIEVMRSRGQIAFFDTAYALLDGKTIEEHSYPVRRAIERGVPTMVAVSFSKSATLYKERVGALMVVIPPEIRGANSPISATAENLTNNLADIIRKSYSSPPALHATAMGEILTTPVLSRLWVSEGEGQSAEIQLGRDLFMQGSIKRGLPTGNAESGSGMFFMGAHPEKVVGSFESEAQLFTVGRRFNAAAIKRHNVDHILNRIVDLYNQLEIPLAKK